MFQKEKEAYYTPIETIKCSFRLGNIYPPSELEELNCPIFHLNFNYNDGPREGKILSERQQMESQLEIKYQEIETISS